ncbi:MAG: lytic transglycosylase domain-containing protein [Bdellovibrionota bacterium]
MNTNSKLKLALALMTLILPLAALSGTAPQSVNLPKTTLSVEQRALRLLHARELLGKYYDKSTARIGESVPKINSAIYGWTKDRLPKKHRKQYQEIAQTIIDESLKYKFDPVFLMSVIQGESSFQPDIVGGVGEIGLMQIRPETAKWITKKFEMEWKGKKSLYDPVTNIRIGAAYLSYLRDRFDMHAQLYLAAYNMGQRNVSNAVEKNIWPKDYPAHVMKHYMDFYTSLEEKAKIKIIEG